MFYNVDSVAFSFETILIQKHIHRYQTVTVISASRVIPISSNLDPGPQGGGHSIVKNTGGGGSWLDSLGSGILVGKRYFGVLQKY